MGRVETLNAYLRTPLPLYAIFLPLFLGVKRSTGDVGRMTAVPIALGHYVW
jgi:hypothetical protein